MPGHTIRVHAGGASPLVSSHFHDEPSIDAMMGFDVGTMGNHEFDEAPDETLQLLSAGRSGASAQGQPG